ncbi:MAG: LysR family transcriptional regulator [Sphingomonas sp. SCN 67-18]|uniref:LysR family transcriptional regulator n=1 Tax=uncultured Sphingomonas sp. TaxID=158754 RepID=UPI000868AF80|nr:LysR family transcriptional regulator [Sphingomonas sp. SCN 67-18]ODU22901.1 MAG: LysR family transcriptional regulator [Sphingomonas sp. SCN 67-18]
MSDWDGFDEIVAVADTGSFVAGARLLGLSTSHISRAVKRLENRIEAQIFARTTRSVTLTDTGRVLIDQCRRIIQERDEALALVRGSEDPHGELRVTCSIALGERFVAPIARRFAEDFPRVSVSLDLNNRLTDLISEGFDLAIRTGTLSDARLVGTQVATRGLYLCAAPAYWDRFGRPECVEDLGRHQCLVGTVPVWQFVIDGQARTFEPTARWRCNSGRAIVDAMLAGLGVSQLPEFYVQRLIRDGMLEPVLEEIRCEDEPIFAAYPQRRHLLPKVHRFVERLSEELPAAMAAG